jgi:hypothetical protein
MKSQHQHYDHAQKVFFAFLIFFTYIFKNLAMEFAATIRQLAN